MSIEGAAVPLELMTQKRFRDKRWNGRGFFHQRAHESNAPLWFVLHDRGRWNCVCCCLFDGRQMMVCKSDGNTEEAAGWLDYKVTGVISYVQQRKWSLFESSEPVCNFWVIWILITNNLLEDTYPVDGPISLIMRNQLICSVTFLSSNL